MIISFWHSIEHRLYVPRALAFKIFAFSHEMYLRVLHDSQNKLRFFYLNRINWLLFAVEMRRASIVLETLYFNII